MLKAFRCMHSKEKLLRVPEAFAASDEIRKSVENRAFENPTLIEPGSTGIRFEPREGILWRGIGDENGGAVESCGDTKALPRNSTLCFSFRTKHPSLLSGEVRARQGADLQPGLRFCILVDDRVIGAPMITASPWESEGNPLTGPAPRIEGHPPSDSVGLAETFIPSGTHFLWFFAPHDRDTGEIDWIELRATEMDQNPRWSFALISDTHLTHDDSCEWMNLKMGFHTTPIFLSTLSSLKAEEIKLVLHGGDITDRGTPEEFHLAGECCDSVDIPIRGCLGNHDLYTASFTCDALAGSLQGIFPNGNSSYVFDMLGLRFWVLDSEKPGFGDSPPTPEENGKPLIILRHYALRNRGGVSSAGFRLLDWGSRQKDEEEALAHPDSFLFINGNGHWTEMMRGDGGTHLQSPALAEWPNAYLVFYVFSKHIRWELRQVHNRAFIAHSAIPEKRLSWMMSTGQGDLSGVSAFRHTMPPSSSYMCRKENT